MAFCTNCGQRLMPGQKFCTKCGKKVIEVVTPTPAPQAVTPPPAPQAITQPSPQAKGNVFDIKALGTKGSWVASSWDIPSVAKASTTSWVSKVKDFFIPQHKLAYLWFLLPVVTTHFTFVSYIFHQIGKLFK
ncbi:MAG: zinc ribbon domain-containing protein [Bacteroidaceae bacterium]|nr:zinc ribbon domain-containing protein [Bacteroidaceae bacterium]